MSPWLSLLCRRKKKCSEDVGNALKSLALNSQAGLWQRTMSTCSPAVSNHVTLHWCPHACCLTATVTHAHPSTVAVWRSVMLWLPLWRPLIPSIVPSTPYPFFPLLMILSDGMKSCWVTLESIDDLRIQLKLLRSSSYQVRVYQCIWRTRRLPVTQPWVMYDCLTIALLRLLVTVVTPLLLGLLSEFVTNPSPSLPQFETLGLSWEALPGALWTVSYEYLGLPNSWKAIFSSCRLSSQPTWCAVRKLGSLLHCPLPPLLSFSKFLKLTMVPVIVLKLWSTCPQNLINPHKAFHTVCGCVGCSMNKGILLRKQDRIQPYTTPKAWAWLWDWPSQRKRQHFIYAFIWVFMTFIILKNIFKI